MCDQQRLRPACAYAQSDQSLCQSLEYSMTVKLLTEQNLEFLSLKGDYTGPSESTLVKTPHCWKSHVTAYVYCGRRRRRSSSRRQIRTGFSSSNGCSIRVSNLKQSSWMFDIHMTFQYIIAR